MKFDTILHYDIAAHLWKKYKSIPDLYKKTFWIIFLILNIVYAFHTINFFWGNHEWPYMKGQISLTNFWFEGRFTETLLYALMGSRILPVLMNIFGFMGISLSTLSLAIYWKLPQKTFVYIGFCLTVALMPYNLVWLYHVAQTSFFWGTFLIVVALEIYEHKCRQTFSTALWNIPVVILLLFVLEMNASFINTIFILMIGRYFIEFIERGKLLTLLKKTLVLLFDIILAVLILKACLIIADHYKILWKIYNIQHISINEIPAKFLKIIPYMWKQFNVTYPFLDSTYLCLLKGMSIFSLITVLFIVIDKRGWLRGSMMFLFMLTGLLFASQLSAFVAKSNVSLVLRVIGYFSHYYIFSLMIGMLFCYFRTVFLKNILFLSTIVLITLNIHRDMYAMRVWQQGRDAENKIMDRVMARVEMLDDFDYKKRYDVVLLGDFSLRRRYYDEAFTHNDLSILAFSYRALWETKTYFNFYGPTDFIREQYGVDDNLKLSPIKKLLPKLTADTLDFIQTKAQPWPDKNSVFIRDGVIFIVLSNNSLNKAKKEIIAFTKRTYSKQIK